MVFICIHDNLMILRVVWVWAREKKKLGVYTWHELASEAPAGCKVDAGM